MKFIYFNGGVIYFNGGVKQKGGMIITVMSVIDGFQSREKTAMLVHKTIANDSSSFA